MRDPALIDVLPWKRYSAGRPQAPGSSVADGLLVGAVQAFEKELFRAATRQPAEGESNIFMCKGLVVVYRSQDETTFFVVGSDDENEVILVRHLTCAARTASGLPRPLGMSCSPISARGCSLLHAYFLRPTANKCGRWESVVRC